jgi:neuronal growth regulator 1
MPEINLPTRRISQIVGKDTILECIITAHPQGQVMWKFHNRLISSSDKYSVRTNICIF